MVTTHVFLPLMWSSTDHSTDNNYKRVGNFNPEPYIHQINQVVYHSADSFGRSRLFDLVCYLLQPRDYLNLRTRLRLYINFSHSAHISVLIVSLTALRGAKTCLSQVSVVNGSSIRDACIPLLLFSLGSACMYMHACVNCTKT